MDTKPHWFNIYCYKCDCIKKGWIWNESNSTTGHITKPGLLSFDQHCDVIDEIQDYNRRQGNSDECKCIWTKINQIRGQPPK